MTPTEWAFLQNFYADHMNACIHCAEVRFSPITFRLWEAIPTPTDIIQDGLLRDAVHEVSLHRGAYEEDKGR